MEEKIELYVRHSASGPVLKLFVPVSLKGQLLASMNSGTLENNELQMGLELSLLPEWITDPNVREKVSALDESIHLRVPLTALSVQFLE